MAAARADFAKGSAEMKALVERKRTLDSQLQECTMVRDELDSLGEGDPVFKSYGSVLIRLDAGEAKGTVAARLKLIGGEQKKVEDALADVQGRLTALREQVRAAQQGAAGGDGA